MTKINDELEVTIEQNEASPTALKRTLDAINTKWVGDNGRINQARAFIKRAKKSDKRRKIEKATRKKNRR